MDAHLSVARWALGDAALALIVVSDVLTGVWLRRRLVPQLTGSQAVLGACCGAIFAAVVEGEALGLASLLRTGPLIGLAALVAATLIATTRGLPTSEAGVRDRTPARAPDLVGLAVGVLLATAHWGGPLRLVLAHGYSEFDTVDYHLPFVLDMVQRHQIRGYTYTDVSATSTYQPQSIELLDAQLALPFRRISLIPLTNLAWTALLLLAAWVAGRSSRVTGRAGLLAAAAGGVVGFPVLQRVIPGEALTDIAALALATAAASLFLVCGRSVGALAMVGGTAGLAIGAKASDLAVGGCVLVAVVALAIRHQARTGALRDIGVAAGAAALGGGFWYARDLVLADNPLAPAHLPGTPRPDLSGLTGFDNSVLHWVGVGGVFPRALYRQLPAAWGHLWFVLVLAAVVLPIATAVAAGQRRARLLAGTAVVAAAVYLVTPSGAAGSADGNNVFGINVRYLLPAVLVGLLAVGADRSGRWRRSRTAGVALVTGLLAVDDLLPSGIRDVPGARPADDVALAVGCLLLTAVVVILVRSRSIRVPGLAVTALALAAGGTVVGIHTDRSQPVAYGDLDPAPALDALGIRAVSYAGTGASFVASNRDLRRRVEPLGVRSGYGGLSAVTSCEQARSVVLGQHVQAVVVVTGGSFQPAAAVVGSIEQAFPSVAARGSTWQIRRVTPQNVCSR